MRQFLALTVVLLVAAFTTQAQAPGSQQTRKESREISSPAVRTGDGQWITLDKALKLAKTNHKKVLIDFGADWCGYCKKMDKEVFPNKQVQSLLNKYFYTVKIDVESKDQVAFRGKTYTKGEFAQAFGVSGLPTYVFIDSTGEPIAGQPGYIPAPAFAKMLSYIGSDAYKTTKFSTYDDSSSR